MWTKNHKPSFQNIWTFGLLMSFILASWFANPVWAADTSSKEKAIRAAFSGADKIVKKKVWINDVQRRKISNICKQLIEDKRVNYFVGYKGGKPMGFATIETVKNRSFPITYMTVLNEDGSVQDVKVLDYQGPRGNFSVLNDSWLDQYDGKNADSDFSNPIKVVGARIAIRTINNGVYKAVAAYKVLMLDKK